MFALCHFAVMGQSYTGLTYNIRLNVASDGENQWDLRKEAMIDQLNFVAPSFFGIQEGKPEQVEYLNDNLSNFNFIGEGRDGGNKGEYSAIFYNKNELEIVNQGTFWLSKTPNKVSKGWDAAFPRVCTYGLFKDKNTQEEFWVFNTHFDHIGEMARLESVKLILKQIKKLTKNTYPVIFMGDLNAMPESKTIVKLNKKMIDAKLDATIVFGPNGTFNAFKFEENLDVRIDYIFTNKKVNTLKYAVLNNFINNRFISDHFPVYIQFQLKTVK